MAIRYALDDAEDISAEELFDRGILEVLIVRETAFAIGDDALIELVDTLLSALGRNAASNRAARVARTRMPRPA